VRRHNLTQILLLHMACGQQRLNHADDLSRPSLATRAYPPAHPSPARQQAPGSPISPIGTRTTSLRICANVEAQNCEIVSPPSDLDDPPRRARMTQTSQATAAVRSKSNDNSISPDPQRRQSAPAVHARFDFQIHHRQTSPRALPQP